MSKALNYLAAVRPDAATHLLSFYKHSVKALDDKTRHLIQIVTKVTVGTERGLRQYAPKALKAGASREEILDAVLMAFPAAGLNKVLDAIAVLSEMDLLPPPPADPNAVAPSTHLGRLEEFPDGRMHCLNRPDGSHLIVFRQGDTARVYDGKCPHAKAPLCQGIDHGERLECRMHNWEFELASGKCLQPAGRPGLTERPARVHDGALVLEG